MKVFLLFCLALVHSDPVHEPGGQSKPPSLSLKWKDKFIIGVTLPDGEQDQIELRHVDTVAGVPCLYEGTLNHDKTGNVAVLGCRDGPETQVTMVSKYSEATMFTIDGKNSTQEIADPYKATNQTNEDKVDNGEEEIIDFEDDDIDEETNLEELERPKRSVYPAEYEDYSFSGAQLDPVPSDLVYEIDVAYEDSFLEKMGNNKVAAEQYILAVVAHMQPYLRHPTLGCRIYVNIRNKPKHLPGKRLQVQPTKANKPIAEAAKISNSNPLAIFVHTDDGDEWMGVAYRGKGCDATKARAILKWRCSLLKAARTASHEIAHLMGNFHDEREDRLKKFEVSGICTGKGIMSETSGILDRPGKWSQCSKLRLQFWFSKFGKDCLTEAPQCNPNHMSTPCICGLNEGALCTEKHTCCEAATSTCLGVKNLDDILAEMSWMKTQIEQLQTKVEYHDVLHSQPSECSSYSELTDSWRRLQYDNRGKFPHHCDKSGSPSSYTQLPAGWYRFTGAAGSKLPTALAPGGGPTNAKQICGTHLVPYIESGGNPTKHEGIVTRDLCWEWQSDRCDMKSTVKVAACTDAQGDYFVYELQPAPVCSAAYCAMP